MALYSSSLACRIHGFMSLTPFLSLRTSTSVLVDHLHPFMLYCHPHGNGVFQQDNCTSHRSRLDEHSSDILRMKNFSHMMQLRQVPQGEFGLVLSSKTWSPMARIEQWDSRGSTAPEAHMVKRALHDPFKDCTTDALIQLSVNSKQVIFGAHGPQMGPNPRQWYIGDAGYFQFWELNSLLLLLEAKDVWVGSIWILWDCCWSTARTGACKE
ncbi:hypothetical protein AVEN_173397-1 [Araneus ventricosus]|uniref:Uncharacterized protein n=1 Tax=Araneus ventricosus TaxID=182803 RepID=A0A4Y2QGF7_ARAVE|nr:hypothetical protein AVEN_173397-1 [Araneus ventricosus]